MEEHEKMKEFSKAEREDYTTVDAVLPMRDLCGESVVTMNKTSIIDQAYIDISGGIQRKNRIENMIACTNDDFPVSVSEVIDAMLITSLKEARKIRGGDDGMKEFSCFQYERELSACQKCIIKCSIRYFEQFIKEEIESQIE